MTISQSLPEGDAPEALWLGHFPTRQQAVVWRNWELISVETLAKVLGTSADNVLALAEELGLRIPPKVNDHWLRRGYVTLIRNNWHLLPYEQLLQLLSWSAEKLAFHLREDDFLYLKLGDLKPHCEPIAYAPLTLEQSRRTEQIRQCMETHFVPLDRGPEEPAFAFVDQYSHAEKPAGPTVPPKDDGRFDLRLIYPYFSVYGDPLMDTEIDPLPEAFLARLAEMGINGVWMQAVLYTLVPFSPAPEFSVGYETRIQNLRALAQRVKRFGLGLYLYFNEPRSMPFSAFENCPERKGVEEPHRGVAAMCTSAPGTLDWLRESTETLFREVPELAGLFTITMSENLTHCHSHSKADACPRCSQRPAQEIVAEVNAAIEQGVHAANPDARVIVWTWGWREAWDHQAVDLLPENIELMCTSERFLPTNVGGVSGEVQDYSISQVGPADNAKSLWRHALDRGLKAIAKVQVNTTWECSAMPYIPAVDLVEEHLSRLSDCDVTGLMASWTLGGFPGGNLELLTRSAQELAESHFGEAAPFVRDAWSQFSKAFREFPFSIWVLYNGPQNVGPMNPLYLSPTGYKATMVGFPYDDLAGWRGIYSEEIFETQLKTLSEMWAEGLEMLARAEVSIANETREDFEELSRVAEATYCHFRSAYLQTAFLRLRDETWLGRPVQVSCGRIAREDCITTSSEQGQDAPVTHGQDVHATLMRAIADEEIDLAKRLYAVARQDATIGFEASNHYAYTLNDLREKVLNCEHVRSMLMEEAR